MKRLGLAIVFILGEVVALAFVLDDLRSGFDQSRARASAVAAVCIGALVGLLLAGRSTARPGIPWVVDVVTGLVTFAVLYVLVILIWADRYSA